MKKHLISILKALFFFAIGFGLLWLIYNSQNAAYQEECMLKGVSPDECSLLDKVINDFKEANYFWIFMVLVSFTISNISRTIKWKMLLEPLGYKPRFINAFGAIIIGYFANLGLPRMGELVRAGTISRYENVPVETSMGTIVTDRIIDVLSIFIVTALALVLQWNEIMSFVSDYSSEILGKVGFLGQALGFSAGLGILGVLLLYIFRHRLKNLHFYQKVKQIFERFVNGISSIAKLQRPWRFVFHSINIWLMYFLMTWLCFFAYEPTADLGPLSGLVVQMAGSWGIVFPSPGGMGSYHFMVQQALEIYGVSGEDSFSWANIAFFSIQLGVNVFLGILMLVLLPLFNKTKPSK